MQWRNGACLSAMRIVDGEQLRRIHAPQDGHLHAPIGANTRSCKLSRQAKPAQALMAL
jgi:hypothetical protein